MLPSAVMKLLPSPVAQPSGNPPEVHPRKKPGRTQVADLAIIVEDGLLATDAKGTRNSTSGRKPDSRRGCDVEAR